MVTHPSPVPFSDRTLQREDVPLRFHATTFGKFLEKAREVAGVTRETFIGTVNEIITKKNEHLPSKDKIQAMTLRVYGNTERKERYPAFEELEPLYEAFSLLLEEPFSAQEREQYIALAQTRIGERKKRPKKGYHPTAQDWQSLRRKLTAFDEHNALGRSAQKGRTPYLLPVPPTDTPQIRLSAQVRSLLNFKAGSIIERDGYVDQVMQLWDQGKRLVVTKALSGTGKTRAFYLLLKCIAHRQNHWPFYYLLRPSSSNQTPDDYLDHLLSLLSTDLRLSSPEEKPATREERMERIFTELARCNQHGLRLAVLVDDAHLLLDPTSGSVPACWQEFFDLWVGREHSALLCLTTREWPHWRGRDRKFLKEIELSPLSPTGGAKLWKDFGFDDVPESLLEEASRKCGGYPHWIERRASDLDEPGHRFLWPEKGEGTFTSDSADNQHTRRIKTWLKREMIFDAITDVAAREELTQIFSRQLPHHVQQVLDLLAVAPLGIPLSLLEQEADHPAQAIDELRRCSLIDSSMLSQERAALVSLAREARLHQLSKEQTEQLEQHVTDIYSHWLNDTQDFKDDAEKAALIAEMIVRYIRARQLLDAAGLSLSYWWLCALFGQANRIQRVFENTIYQDRGKQDNVANEAGKILLQYHIKLKIGQKIDIRARDTAFRYIHDLVLEGKITLYPHAEIYLIHTLMQRFIHEKRYKDAYGFLQNTFDRMSQVHRMVSDVLASFLHSKASLLGKWSRNVVDTDEAARLTQECVSVLDKVVETLRGCLKSAMPVQERYHECKLARALNDLAYYSRLLGQFDIAESAIRESLYLKDEKKADSPSSLAISLSEFAQILVIKGEYREADEKNDQAIQILDQILQSGDSSVSGTKGMLLFERANIYIMQGRLEEEKQLLHEALKILNDKRDHFRVEAKQRLARIQVIEESSPRYQLDSHWYQRYLPIAQFDDLTLLAQAGPFSDEDKRDWDKWYPRRKEAIAQRQIADIIGRSREREFKQSGIEGRLPRIYYPAIDIEDVFTRIQDFSVLRDDITEKEPHPIIRRLYLDKIEEQLLGLHLIKATYAQDIDAIHTYNEALYGRIGRDEMVIVLRELFKMLMRARSHPQAGEIVEQLLKQLKEWQLSVEDFLSLEEILEKRVVSEKLRMWRETSVSSHMVQRFYQEALQAYGFTEWRVVPSPDRDAISLDLDSCEMHLPTHNRFTVLSVAELLAEEIETHVLRSVAGKRSKVALLSSGTCRFLSTEEGLAILAKQEMMATHELEQNKAWLSTLAPGIASGVLTPPQSFRTLLEFFKKVFLVNRLRSGQRKTVRDVEQQAWQDALSRVSRTFFGVTDLEVAGVCNLKDKVYLQGYREVSEKIATTPIERLFVGSIGINDLEAMENLHILQPPIEHLHLARDPQLFDRIMAL